MGTTDFRVGRPTKLTPGIRTALIALAGKGMTFEQVSATLKVGSDTILDWRKKDPEIGVEIEAERAKYEQELLTEVRDLGRKSRDWRGAAWTLEKLYPKKYGKRVVVSDERNIQTEAGFIEASRGPKTDP